MEGVKSRIHFCALVRQGLELAKVDLPWFYEEMRQNGTGVRNLEGRVIALISHPLFAQPERLSALGYPEESIRQAEIMAERMAERAIAEVITIYRQIRQAAESRQPKEGLNEKDVRD